MNTKNEPENPPPASKSIQPGRRIWPAIRALLRTRIMAGLATVVPLWVTWVILKFVFDTTRSATQPIVDWIVSRSEAAAEGAEAVSNAAVEMTAETQEVVSQVVPSYVPWIVPIVAVMLTLFLLYLLGLLTANVIGRRVVLLVERLFESLPLVKTIYSSTKRIVLTLAGGGDSMQFQKVVLVEFPRPGMKCIGFLTSVMEDVDTGRKMATVFISTTPNPTTGYMQIIPLEEVSETGWSVEEAVKLLMSGGILSPARVPFDKVHPVVSAPAIADGVLPKP